MNQIPSQCWPVICWPIKTAQHGSWATMAGIFWAFWKHTAGRKHESCPGYLRRNLRCGFPVVRCLEIIFTDGGLIKEKPCESSSVWLILSQGRLEFMILRVVNAGLAWRCLDREELLDMQVGLLSHSWAIHSTQRKSGCRASHLLTQSTVRALPDSPRQRGNAACMHFSLLCFADEPDVLPPCAAGAFDVVKKTIQWEGPLGLYKVSSEPISCWLLN